MLTQQLKIAQTADHYRCNFRNIIERLGSYLLVTGIGENRVDLDAAETGRIEIDDDILMLYHSAAGYQGYTPEHR
ncbi:hypothetical protein JW805_01455 [Roseomonas aeriglobus]|nr:hypothetical protein [Roseomonas aeriglobus]